MISVKFHRKVLKYLFNYDTINQSNAQIEFLKIIELYEKIIKKTGIMAIKLFEHNMKACRSALKLMELTGKAAIIHPIGTDKYIVF